jgi:hypothetical protein
MGAPDRAIAPTSLFVIAQALKQIRKVSNVGGLPGAPIKNDEYLAAPASNDEAPKSLNRKKHSLRLSESYE